MKPRLSLTEKAGRGHAINPLGFELKASLFHQQGRVGISLGDLLKCSGHVENNQRINQRCGSPSVPPPHRKSYFLTPEVVMFHHGWLVLSLCVIRKTTGVTLW